MAGFEAREDRVLRKNFSFHGLPFDIVFHLATEYMYDVCAFRGFYLACRDHATLLRDHEFWRRAMSICYGVDSFPFDAVHRLFLKALPWNYICRRTQRACPPHSLDIVASTADVPRETTLRTAVGFMWKSCAIRKKCDLFRRKVSCSRFLTAAFHPSMAIRGDAFISEVKENNTDSDNEIDKTDGSDASSVDILLRVAVKLVSRRHNLNSKDREELRYGHRAFSERVRSGKHTCFEAVQMDMEDLRDRGIITARGFV